MGRAFGFLTLILVVGIGGYIYMQQVQTVTPVGSIPSTMLDITGVRNDLMAMANAERRYFAVNTRYASLDELAENGDIQIPTRSNYSYSAETSETEFTITATYSGPDPKAPQRISINQSMMLKTE